MKAPVRRTGAAVPLLVLMLACAFVVLFLTTSFRDVVRNYANKAHTSTSKRRAASYNEGGADEAINEYHFDRRGSGEEDGSAEAWAEKYVEVGLAHHTDKKRGERSKYRSSNATIIGDESRAKLGPRGARRRHRHQARQFDELTDKGVPRRQRPVSSEDDEQPRQGKRHKNHHYHYHDYAVFIVHYHKTGYVLSRELKNLLREIEVAAYDPPNPKDYIKPVQFTQSGIDDEGVRFAFDQMGNWGRSAFPQRRHTGLGGCPKMFELHRGTVYVQESPDLFCGDEELLDSMQTRRGGTKIIHFVRNSFDMVMSNYFYHSQDPTPEKWVHGDDPCYHLYSDNTTLSSHITPTLASWTETTSHLPDITEEQLNKTMDGILDVCQSLYQTKRKLESGTFYEHLLKLSKRDGLRLATAQMTIASGEANKHLAGGDVLRMANNLARFQKLQQNPESNVHLLTVSMDDFIKNTRENTKKFFDFIFGENTSVISEEMRWGAARRQEEKYQKKKSRSHHITQSNDTSVKDALRSMLKTDEDLGPILNLTEMLVNDALAANG